LEQLGGLQQRVAGAIAGAYQFVVQRGKGKLLTHGKFEIGGIAGCQTVRDGKPVHVAQNVISAFAVELDIERLQRRQQGADLEIGEYAILLGLGRTAETS
jgi:hypothetical protein